MIYSLTVICLILSIIGIVGSAILLRNNKRKKTRIDESVLKYNNLDQQYSFIKNKELVQDRIINCTNQMMKDEESFKNDLLELASDLSSIFECEYCIIGCVLENTLEDVTVGTRIHYKQEVLAKIKKNVSLTLIDIIRNNNLQGNIIHLQENDFTEINTQIINPQHPFLNGTIVQIKGMKNDILGYIIFLNSKMFISPLSLSPYINCINNFMQFLHNQLILKKELLKKEEFAKDSSFIKSLITKKDNIDNLLSIISLYFIAEFNAAIVSFRIPILNGVDDSPIFYLRKCIVHNSITNAKEIEEYYKEVRFIKREEELGGYANLQCNELGEISYEESNDFEYCEIFNLKNIIKTKKSIVVPVIRNLSTCRSCKENKDRFKNLYGIFKLRIHDNIEESNLEHINARLKYLSEQITLILNSNIDKYYSESIKLFQTELKNLNFTRIRDFDKQVVTLIKNATRSKGCSIYRLKKNQNFDDILSLTATTAKGIRKEGIIYPYNEQQITDDLVYSVSDNTNVITRVFQNKKSKYLLNLEPINHYFNKIIEIMESENMVNPENETYFISPLMKKDGTSLGVVVLIGKEQSKGNISPAFWEQDKEFIEFIIDIIARLSEADTEKLTFLSQLGHELTSPITEIVHTNDELVKRYERDRNSLSKDHIIRQVKDNMDSAFLFKQIIMDIELGYSLSTENIVCNIQLEKDSKGILTRAVRLLEKEASANKGVSIRTNIGQMPPLYMDKHRITQVYINLIKNAIRYSSHFSTIDIFYTHMEKDNSQKWHEIKFSNYGIGIKEDEVDKIFELYMRGEYAKKERSSGTGLGLYIVKNIIEAHGGHCTVIRRNNPTQISIMLPDIQ